MKTQKAYATAMKTLGNLDSIESVDELKTAMGDIIANIEAHTGALNSEAKTHRESKSVFEKTLNDIGSDLGIEIESSSSVTDYVQTLKSSGDQTNTDLVTRLSKLEKQLGSEISLRESAEATALKVTNEKNQQTITNKVNGLLESAKVMPIHRDLLSEKLSRDLKLDSDGDITDGNGTMVADIVGEYIEANRDSGIIQNTQKSGGGNTPPSGSGGEAPTSVRANIEAFASKYQK
tara:strand:- start:5471 stop:6172 length:702 start_codon:yes stop_codon:yes gene_type:complete